jgi:flagellar motor switch protein FliM
MPMLHVIFDQMTNLCAESLRSMSPSQSYFSLSSVGSSRLSDILDHYEGDSIAAVFYAQAWDARILIGFDRDFVYTMVELLFGADGAEPPLDMPRVFSNVELRCADAARPLRQAAVVFSRPLNYVQSERVETRMITGDRPAANMAVRQILLQGDRGGEMFIVIPHSALNPSVRRSLRLCPANRSPRIQTGASNCTARFSAPRWC